MLKSSKSNHNNVIVGFVFLLVIAGQSAVDIYLPSLPAMAVYFHTNAEQIQLTLSLFILGYASSQLIYGILSDHFGRRPTLLLGMALFSISSIFCALATSIKFLLLFRLLQGLSAGVTNVHQRALIRDIFSGNELRKRAAQVATIWAFVPIVAPIIGGYIEFYANWRFQFVLLALFEIGLLFTLFRKLPETNKDTRKHPLHFKIIFKNYRTLLMHSVFVGNVLVCATLNGIFLILNISIPYLLQIELNLSAVACGWSIILTGTGFLLGSYINSYFSYRISSQQMIFYGFLLMFLSSLILMLFLLNDYITLATFLIPLCGFFIGLGFIYANCVAGAMQCFSDIIGTAGAFYGFLVSGIGSLLSILFSHYLNTSFASVISSIIILSCISLFIYCYIVMRTQPVLQSQ